MLPNNTQTNGAKRYTYNSAGYLTQVESHNGATYTTQAQMTYNGLGQRLSMDASGVIAYYVMDNNRPLTATTGNDTTSYLYGLGVIGEENTAWSYSLTDGTNTQRQLTDSTGEVTYSARYTPWGDTLESAGTGNFTFGYFGGLMDEATGLMYVGEGQYYDPSTGRFLTRNPNASGNPYLPFDPTGALFVPLAFLGLIYGRKKHKNKLDYVVIVVFMSLGVGLGLTACGGGKTVEFEATVTPLPTAIPTQLIEATLSTGESGTAIIPVTATTTPSYFCGLPVSTSPNETELNITLDELVAYIQKTNQADKVNYSDVREQLHRLMKLAGEQRLNTNHLAYLYATVQVETNWRDFEERGDSAYFKRYDGIYGNIHEGDGERYKGRGFVHLTFRDNYISASKGLGLSVFGVDGTTPLEELEQYPYRALMRPDDPNNPRPRYDYSGNIAVEGMKNGWFTGIGLLSPDLDHADGSYDFYGARSIINWGDANGGDPRQRAGDLAIGFAEILNKHCPLGGTETIICVMCK